MVLIIGFKGHSMTSEVEVIYCGQSGVDAEAAVAKLTAKSGFVRIGKLVNPQMIPVRLPECLLGHVVSALPAEPEKASPPISKPPKTK